MANELAEAVALHRWAVIAEAANPRLRPAERGVVVSAAAQRSHVHPDGIQSESAWVLRRLVRLVFQVCLGRPGNDCGTAASGGSPAEQLVDRDGLVAAGAETADSDAAHEGAAVLASLLAEESCAAAVAFDTFVDRVIPPRRRRRGNQDSGLASTGSAPVGGDPTGVPAVAALAGSHERVPHTGHSIVTGSLLDGITRQAPRCGCGGRRPRPQQG